MKVQGVLLPLLAGYFVQIAWAQYNWDAWKEWSNCSVTCGAGVRKRFRISRGPGLAASTGIKIIQTKPCHLSNCTEGWSRWTRGPCSVTCGVGSSVRHRICLGEYCDNEMEGSRQNETHKCRRRKCQNSSSLQHAGSGERTETTISPLQQLINHFIQLQS